MPVEHEEKTTPFNSQPNDTKTATTSSLAQPDSGRDAEQAKRSSGRAEAASTAARHAEKAAKGAESAAEEAAATAEVAVGVAVGSVMDATMIAQREAASAREAAALAAIEAEAARAALVETLDYARQALAARESAAEIAEVERQVITETASAEAAARALVVEGLVRERLEERRHEPPETSTDAAVEGSATPEGATPASGPGRAANGGNHGESDDRNGSVAPILGFKVLGTWLGLGTPRG